MWSNNKPLVITFLVVLVAIVGLIAYFMTSSAPEEVTESVAVPEVVEPQPLPEPVEEPAPPAPEPPEPPPEPEFVLPRLDESDPLIRDGVVTLTRHEGVNEWLAPNQLARKYVAFVDNIAHGQVAKEPARALAPEGPFLVKKIDDSTFEIDPAGYDRYNKFVEVVTSVDAKRAAEFYHLLKPLMQDAYGELGYGDQSFEDVMFQAIGRLLETPAVEGPIRLKRPVVMYKFEDERLENLSAAQKQLIRMGPRNTRLLQEKISEVALELRAMLDR